MIERISRLCEFPWLVHGFTTRQGGVSKPPYDTLNIAFSRPDDPAAVLENRRRVAAALEFDLQDVVIAAQVHGTHVTRARAEHRGRGAVVSDTVLPASDALISDEPGVVLWAGFGDCTPLLFIDPIHRAVGVAHAGWQGTVENIAGATIEAMQAAFGTNPAELLAVIGPAIGPCCYEVGEPVIKRAGTAFNDQTSDILLRVPGKERPHFDLWHANRLQLEAAGLHPERILDTQICTACNHEQFFSHRRDKGITGRFAAIIGVRRGGDDGC